MKEKISFVAWYPHRPERVWKALTDPAQLSQWLMACLAADGGFTLGDGRIRCTVLEQEEPWLLKYLWDDGSDGEPSVVSWRLEPIDGGTRLSLDHEAAVDAQPYVLLEADANWAHALRHGLPMALARPPVPIVYDTDDAPDPKLARAGFRQEAR